MRIVVLALIAMLIGIGCQTTPQGINQTSKVPIGTTIWEFKTGGLCPPPPPSDLMARFTSGQMTKKLYAINGKSGVKLWEFETGGDVPPPPPSDLMARFTLGQRTKSSMPSMARVGSSYGNLKREVCGSSPAIGSDGTVYVGSDDKKLYAINGKSGVKLWEFETEVLCLLPRHRILMARFTSGHGTKSSMPSMARVGSSYGNLKRGR